MTNRRFSSATLPGSKTYPDTSAIVFSSGSLTLGQRKPGAGQMLVLSLDDAQTRALYELLKTEMEGRRV